MRIERLPLGGTTAACRKVAGLKARTSSTFEWANRIKTIRPRSVFFSSSGEYGTEKPRGNVKMLPRGSLYRPAPTRAANIKYYS